MSQPTGFHDARGIPIHVGDLIRVKHYTHRLRHEQMWAYFRVGFVRDRFVLHVWSDLDASKYHCLLEAVGGSPDDIEVLAKIGTEYNHCGELITFNERPRLRRKAGE
jgi:hypothetical protein